MRKLILLATIILGLNTITKAQVSVSEENDVKNFRFGLKGDLSINWLKAEENEAKNQGVGIGYAWGLQTEFKLNNTISFVTGLNLLSSAYTLNYEPRASYYVLNAENKYVDISSNTQGQYDTANQTKYLLNSRNFRANYVNIPIGLKMKTKEIGYMTYFGEFGGNINVLTKSKAITDKVNLNGNNVEITNKIMTSSTGRVTAGIKVGGGAEYNFSGTTSLFCGVYYNHYFTNALRKNDKYLQTPDLLSTSGEYKSAGLVAIPGAVSLTVGILF